MKSYLWHSQDDHHVCMEASMFVPVGTDSCICGDVPNDPIHSAPPCEWCRDADLGEPAPWWHRVWCRLATWLLVEKEK